MRKRRKKNSCLNCGYTLNEIYNYCPNCGQENNDNNISFGILFREFFSNYFSLDSRFGRSFKPFFFNPGKLTKEFIAGRRVKYANPVRFYLVISLFHFFFFAWLTKPEGSNKAVVSFSSSDGVTREQADSIAAKQLEDVDSILTEQGIENPIKSLQIEDKDDWPLSNDQERIMQEMNDSGDYTVQEVLDSLNIEDRSAFDRFVIERIVKISRATEADINRAVIQNIPVMMFFILPIYALLLKLFYRKKGLYILHLIHSLHIHTFSFFVLGLSWAIELITGIDSDRFIVWSILLITIYIVLSLRNVYQQKFFKTIVKLFGIGFIYSLVLAFALLIEVFVSLAFF